MLHYLFFFFFFFSFHPNFLWTSSQLSLDGCSEILGYIRYGYEVLQEGFKIQNGRLKGSPRGMSKSVQILSRLVLSNLCTDGSEILGYDRYGYEVLQEGFKGPPPPSPGYAPPPSLHKRLNISNSSEPLPKPYILLFLTIRHF